MDDCELMRRKTKSPDSLVEAGLLKSLIKKDSRHSRVATGFR